MLSRIAAKDQRAMRELFDKFGGLVYSIALRVLKDTGHAEDVMQDVFFTVWRNPASFVPGRGSLGAWLTVVTRNRALDLLRTRRPGDSVECSILRSKMNHAFEFERSELFGKARSVLLGLPLRQQAVIEMAFFAGLTHTEIAIKTGEPLGTIKTRIRAALINLRAAITDTGNLP